MSDDNPRPSKRQRTTSQVAPSELTPLPPPTLLVSLPGLLVHPPTSDYHPHSLNLSLVAIRKCLALGSVSPEIECRAWLSLAELGMNVIDGGFTNKPEHSWAHGLEQEVENAINKGLLLAQKHTSLRWFKLRLTLIQARMSHREHNYKFARNLIRRMISSFTPSDERALVYSAHLSLVAQLLAVTGDNESAATLDLHEALSAVKALQAVAAKYGDRQVVLLTHVLKLGTLISRGLWSLVPACIQTTESALGLSYASHTDGKKSPEKSQEQRTETIAFDDPFEGLMAIHTLVMVITYYTHAGLATDASPRLSHLHTLLDSGAMDAFPDGIVQIQLPMGPPLAVQTTHPRVLFYLGFLLSSLTKRDAVGRKPRRKVFAAEGLAQWDKDSAPHLICQPWASLGEVDEIGHRLVRIKADLISELVAVAIMRSEFDEAEENLAALIAHVRTWELWDAYAPRITLHHAHLAHALGQSARAAQCYRLAAHLAPKGDFVHASALAGDAALLIGLARRGETGVREDERRVRARAAADACHGMGGTLEAVGQILEACLAPEILKAKQHLKQALALATKAQDNHLRALVLALISMHYMHTSAEHAQAMLATCDQLAAGLGAPADKASAAGAGNAPLRLWVGERVLELHKRAGREERVRKQAAQNAELAKAVERLVERSAVET